ncbi:hypothetical protein Mame01_54050 [Microbispora amethystogenes]|nr:hypothetical protein Mame01_54050 [Microbispora amethystogenes]
MSSATPSLGSIRKGVELLSIESGIHSAFLGALFFLYGILAARPRKTHRCLSIAGPGTVVGESPLFGGVAQFREADMNGFLPYRDSTPATRVGGVRGWQADILRGES